MTLRSYWRPTRDEVVASNGMVTAMEAPAAEVGLEILKRGGNAVDAAVAVGFCNVVLEPFMATIGGMGYMLVHMAKEGKTVAIDFNGRAPKKAHPDMYKVIGPAEAGGYHIFDVEDDAHSQGASCATVPTLCAGLCEAHRLFGTLPLEELLEPAIHMASEGFDARWHLTLYAANDFESLNIDRYLSSMWLPEGRPPRSVEPADKIVQKDLGVLLKRIAKHGADGMYRGEVAEMIDEFMRDKGGFLSKEDLAEYKPIVGKPLSVPFKGHEIKAVNTPSGGITNLQTFRIMERFDLNVLGQNSVEYLHLYIEASRHAFADRFRYIGDWDYVPVPLKGMLSGRYARDIARQINLNRSSVGQDYEGEPWSYYLENALHDPWKYESSKNSKVVLEAASDNNNESTTHFNVVDRDRNAVSCTHTGVFTSGANPPKTGVYLVGGMAWFIPKGGYANSIAGWKRPMNNLAPIIAFRDGKPVLCQGAPGARRIMCRGIQVVTNILVFGMTPQRAIDAPTVDTSGRDTLVNARMPDEIIGALSKMGHRIQIAEEEPGLTGRFSRPSAIYIDHENGLLRAGVDSFRPSMAVGY